MGKSCNRREVLLNIHEYCNFKNRLRHRDQDLKEILKKKIVPYADSGIIDNYFL